MKGRIKTKLIQLAGLILCLCCACAGILWHIDKTEEAETTPETPSAAVKPDNDITAETEQSYDPLADIYNIFLPDETEVKVYDYSEYAKSYTTAAYLKTQGYKLTGGSYNGEDCKVGYVSVGLKLPGDFSQAEHKVTRAVTEEGKKGGFDSKNETVTEDCPLLIPYYGYIIYTSEYSRMLLDNNGNVLMNNIKGYNPAYMTDYCGNPLFEKDGKYYFYYSGKGYKGAAYSEVEIDYYTQRSTALPEAYKYFVYDVDMLHNLFVTNDFTNEANMKGIAYNLPTYPCMVEFAVDSETLFDLTVPSACYNGAELELYRFPSYTYTKNEEKRIDDKPYYSYEVTDILWGYMDAKGKVVVEPVYKKAYNFSKDGFAVVEDKHGHLCVLNRWGSIVYNYYETIHYFPEMGNQKIRDGHYIPDTLGVENTGMLWFDQGYVRMRRKLVDTENGYIVKREMQTIVDTVGKTVNIPTDCTLVGYADGVMLLQRGDKFGYMKADGDWLIEPTLPYAKPFSEGLAVIGYSKDSFGVIDTEGNIILYPMYQHIESCSGGVITAYSTKGGWTVYNKMTSKTENTAENPIISLKKLAIAQAKYEFQKQKEAANELPSGQS